MSIFVVFFSSDLFWLRHVANQMYNLDRRVSLLFVLIYIANRSDSRNWWSETRFTNEYNYFKLIVVHHAHKEPFKAYVVSFTILQ